jgi:DNA replication protein DnaC
MRKLSDAIKGDLSHLLERKSTSPETKVQCKNAEEIENERKQMTGDWRRCAGLSFDEMEKFRHVDMNVAHRSSFQRIMAWDPVEHDHGLFLMGPNGCGKTHLMHYLIIKHSSPSLTCSILRFSDMMTRFKESLDTGAKSTEMAALCDPELLFIDDLCPVRSAFSPYEADTFLDLVESRLKLRKRVFLSAHKSRQDLRSLLGDVLIDKLKEQLLFIELDATAESYREKIHRRKHAKFFGREFVESPPEIVSVENAYFMRKWPQYREMASVRSIHGG